MPKRFSFRWLLAVVPLMAILVSVDFPSGAWAAVRQSEPPATTSVTGQDPSGVADCWDDAGGWNWVYDIRWIRWIYEGPVAIPIPDRKPVLGAGVAQTPITDDQGKVLGTLTLFHSKKCAGYFGVVQASGNAKAHMQAIALTGTQAYAGLSAYQRLGVSPMVADGPQVCVQGNIDEESTTYSASVCNTDH
ncbi:hypothetical protein [Dictyobacter kobayashii]|uniref:Uncharacterized protein n=1 Tax=Dictyobacter kobayashii TaxID=2014872 RepID=A0A402ASE6_9CHLR|nr:hypothetical protein [Dictyobacter kobayashii]GCE22021.1 hypothetical protein KDK_58210 [Dictyobacter kobayashii]